MENWNVANLTEEQLLSVKDLEKSLGVSLVAYSSDSKEENQESVKVQED